MFIEIETVGRMVKVRRARSASDCIRVWDLVWKGQIHPGTGKSFDDLDTLGDGFHEV